MSPLIDHPDMRRPLRTRRRAVQVEAHEQLAALLDSICIEQTCALMCRDRARVPIASRFSSRVKEL